MIAGHHRQLNRRENRLACCEAEKQLIGYHASLDEYIAQLRPHIQGRGVRIFKRLLHLKQQYPAEAFMAAIQQAKQYGLYNLQRLEKLIIRYVSGEFFNL